MVIFNRVFLVKWFFFFNPRFSFSTMTETAQNVDPQKPDSLATASDLQTLPTLPTLLEHEVKSPEPTAAPVSPSPTPSPPPRIASPPPIPTSTPQPVPLYPPRQQKPPRRNKVSYYFEFLLLNILQACLQSNGLVLSKSISSSYKSRKRAEVNCEV